MSTFQRLLLALLWAALLSSCGGGRVDGDLPAASAQAATASAAFSAVAQDAPAAEQAAGALRARARALAAQSVSSASAAAQLLDFAELQFPAFFPGRPATQSLPPFLFRHYPSTGTYLGVVVTAGMGYEQLGVYVMGGSFGAAPQFVGPLAQFISPGAEPAVRIEQQPDDRAVVVGDTAEFSVIAAGKLPLSYQWYHEGGAVSGAVGASLRIAPVAAVHRGHYSVEVRDADGRATMSNRVALIVRENGVVPANITAMLQQRACSACHDAARKLVGPSWADIARRYAGQSGQETYLVQRIQQGGRDVWGAVPMPATSMPLAEAQAVARWLIGGSVGGPIGSAPVLAALPAALTADIGTSLRLQASAEGSLPLAYQWRRNGVDIAGATAAVLELGPLDPADHESTYTVVVRNAAGSARSSTVLRVVDPAAFPSEPLTIVVPYAAGGALDVMGRALADTLRDRVRGLSVSVLNVSASAGLAALDRVLASPPNGYTLLLADARLAAAPALYPERGLDLLRDLEPLGVLTRQPLVLLGGPHMPAGGAAELLAGWRGRSTPPSFGHLGAGDLSQRCALMLADALGLPLSLKAYQGSAVIATDLLDRRVDLTCLSAPSLSTQVQRNQVRAYAVTGLERSNVPALAAVETLDRSGLSGFELADWYGLYVRRGTSPLVLQRLQDALASAREAPYLQAQAAQRGQHLAVPPLSTAEGHRAHLEAEIARWRALVLKHGLKPD